MLTVAAPVFISGFFFGILVCLLILMVYASRISDTLSAKKGVKDAIKDIELVGSIKYRFNKVTELTERQMSIISSAERPSANASHSRHQNNIAGELKAIELEKIEIFKSILADGVDPQLSIVIDGISQNMRMSEAVALFEENNDSGYSPSKKTESITSHKNGLRLVQTKENSDESGGPTIS